MVVLVMRWWRLPEQKCLLRIFVTYPIYYAKPQITPMIQTSSLPGQCNQVSSCCWCCLVLFAVSNVDLQQRDDLYLNGWRLVGQIYIAYTYVTRCVNIHKDRMATGASLPTELLSCGWNEPLLLVTNRMADVSYHLSMSK